jgi:hypothetical protein
MKSVEFERGERLGCALRFLGLTQEAVASAIEEDGVRKKDVDYALEQPKGWTKSILACADPDKVSLGEISDLFWALGFRVSVEITPLDE